MHFGKAIGIVFACTISQFSYSSSLNDVYQRALENDHRYRADRAAFDAGQENKALGRSALLPKINGQVTWQDSDTNTNGVSDEFDTMTSTVLRDQAVDTEITTTESGYSVTLVQPLFDLAGWHTYKQGKVDAKAAEADFKANQQALIIRSAEAYFDALRAVDNFEAAKAEEKALSHQLSQTNKRFEVGLTAITEVHEAQASYDTAVANRLLLEGQVGIAFDALEVITGQSYQQLQPLKEAFPIVPPTPSEQTQWVDFSVKNNFRLAAASLRAQSARQSANQRRAGHLPTLTGSVTMFDNNSEGDTNGLMSDIDRDGQAVALTLDVPIFNGGAVSAARKQAANNYIQSRESYLQTQRDTIQQARALHLSVLTDVATVKARKQAITSSQSALEATQAGYDVGTRNLVDILVAQRSLYAAQRNYADALYTYVLNTLKLKEVAGLLTENDVTELDKWLDRTRTVSRITR